MTVTGFKELPNFGDQFIEVADEKTARKQALLNAQGNSDALASSNVTSSDLLRMMNVADNSKVFNVIVKGDVLGSVTSVVDSLKMIDTHGEVNLNIVSTGVGDITENDIYMAAGDNTVIYGFNVAVPTNIAKMAARDGVAVRNYRVIYELIDDAKSAMEELLDAEVIEEEVGEMKIKGVFRTERTAIIAGGEVLTGRVAAKVAATTGEELKVFGRVYRNKELIGEVQVDSVQKEKMAVSELVAGETGGIAFNLEKRLVIELNDRVKFFTRELRKKKL